jgi:hypothetical protein
MEYRCSRLDVGMTNVEPKIDAHMRQWASAGWSLMNVTYAPYIYTFFWRK